MQRFLFFKNAKFTSYYNGWVLGRQAVVTREIPPFAPLVKQAFFRRACYRRLDYRTALLLAVSEGKERWRGRRRFSLPRIFHSISHRAVPKRVRSSTSKNRRERYNVRGGLVRETGLEFNEQNHLCHILCTQVFLCTICGIFIQFCTVQYSPIASYKG